MEIDKGKEFIKNAKKNSWILIGEVIGAKRNLHYWMLIKMVDIPKIIYNYKNEKY